MKKRTIPTTDNERSNAILLLLFIPGSSISHTNKLCPNHPEYCRELHLEALSLAQHKQVASHQLRSHEDQNKELYQHEDEPEEDA